MTELEFLKELNIWLSRQHGMIAKDYAKELARYILIREKAKESKPQ